MLKDRAPGAPKPREHLQPNVQGKHGVDKPEKEIQMGYQTQTGRNAYGVWIDLGS